MVESYLNDFVWPFSRNTFSTFAIGGTRTSLSEKAEGCDVMGCDVREEEIYVCDKHKM